MPRRKRKVTGKAPANKKKSKLSQEERLQKYKDWSDVSMVGAMKAVAEGLGINRAALEFGVPKTTLKDRVSGRVKHGTKSGRVPFLSYAEEEELVEYLVTCSKIGYSKTRDDVIGIVRKTLQNKANGPIEFKGKGWWTRFMERWPKLALRNLLSGFKKVGICPSNADAIKSPDPPSSLVTSDHPDDNLSDQESVNDEEVPLPEAASLPSSEMNPSSSSVLTVQNNTMFTPEQLELFQSRYENGYVKM